MKYKEIIPDTEITLTLKVNDVYFIAGVHYVVVYHTIYGLCMRTIQDYIDGIESYISIYNLRITLFNTWRLGSIDNNGILTTKNVIEFSKSLIPN